MCDISAGFFSDGFVKGFIEGYTEGYNESSNDCITTAQAACMIYHDDELISEIAEYLCAAVYSIKQKVATYMTAEDKCKIK